MNSPAYEFHNPISRIKKVWKRSHYTKNIPFDRDKYILFTLSRGGDVTDATDELFVNLDFDTNPRFLFVDRKLSSFLDSMHINGVPSDYIENTCKILQGTFLLVWGDGSTNLCDISFVEREKKRRMEVVSVAEKHFGRSCEWENNGIEKGFRIYAAIDSNSPSDVFDVLGVRQTATIFKKVRDSDIETITRRDYNVAEDKTRIFIHNPLNKEEESLIGLTVTRLIKLLVYIASYPENLKDGIVGDCALSGLQPKHISKSSRTMTIKTEHREVSSHIRRQFFRLYPMRRNGERKPGLVFVKSTIVKGTAETAVNNG